ncbi:MAG: helix-turn-helix domain-containing protein [Chitinophagaceae bacterium]|nr:MAG: helix-turn-helix domain-containing protein [Chitinophagaceae bacterium]
MSSKINLELAANIKKLRALRGLDARIMADHLKISGSAYARIERGETQIDIDRLASMADILNVDPKDLLTLVPGNLFEQDGHVPNVHRADPGNHYSVSKEIIDNLTNQLAIKDDQLRAKDEQLREQQKTIAKLLEHTLQNLLTQR